ncbi:MAG: MFS transporter [Acidimicrobiales bacterium]
MSVLVSEVVAGNGAIGARGPDSGIWAPPRRRLTVGLVLAVTLVAFEALAIATVMPVVARHLGDIRLYGWVFSAFMLASLVGIVAGGGLADRVPLTAPMVGGLAFFAAGLLIGGTATSMPVLVAGRAVQGVGAGVVPSMAYVAISRGYPPESRPRMFAVLSTAWVVPGLAGPAIATGITAAAGWRWVFLALLPLVVVAGGVALVGLRSLPTTGRRALAPGRARARAGSQAVAVTGVVLGAGGLLATLTAGDLIAVVPGVAVGGGVLVWCLRRLTPEGTLTVRRGLPATVASRGLITACFYAADAYVPYEVTTVRHSPTFLTGLVLTAATVTWTAGSWIQARTVQRVGPRRLIRLGEALVVLAIGAMVAVLLPGVPPPVAIPAWGLAGLGMGIAYAPLSLATLDRAGPGEEGAATSSLQLCDVLGTALGTGVAGALVAASVHGLHLGAPTGVALAFAVGAAVGLVAIVAGSRLPERLLAGGAGPADAPRPQGSAGADVGGPALSPRPAEA